MKTYTGVISTKKTTKQNAPLGTIFDRAHSTGFWLHQNPYPINHIDDDDDDGDDARYGQLGHRLRQLEAGCNGST